LIRIEEDKLWGKAIARITAGSREKTTNRAFRFGCISAKDSLDLAQSLNIPIVKIGTMSIKASAMVNKGCVHKLKSLPPRLRKTALAAVKGITVLRIWLIRIFIIFYRWSSETTRSGCNEINKFLQF
jgi:hypothetical protein